jgi:hypothetical protein
MKTEDGTYYPDYARMAPEGKDGGTVLRFSRLDRTGYAEYYKVCGDWSAYFRYRYNKLVCTNTPYGEGEITKYMRGKVLTECTQEEFKEDNPYGIHDKHEYEVRMFEERRKASKVSYIEPIDGGRVTVEDDYDEDGKRHHHITYENPDKYPIDKRW